MIDERFLRRPVPEVARALVGCTFLREGCGGVIVETEAYDKGDPASHSWRGPTPRNAAMFGPPGRLYVYRSYGLHWCVNLVCGPEPGGAVLLRALAPEAGLAAMRARRGLKAARLLCAGPGRLCQALGITGADDGCDVRGAPFALLPGGVAPGALATGPRIGLARAVDRPWRFGLRGSPFLSRPFSAVAAPPADRASPH